MSIKSGKKNSEQTEIKLKIRTTNRMQHLLFRWFISVLSKTTFEMIGQVVNDCCERETRRTSSVKRIFFRSLHHVFFFIMHVTSSCLLSNSTRSYGIKLDFICNWRFIMSVK
jgi:hypothetical protein